MNLKFESQTYFNINISYNTFLKKLNYINLPIIKIEKIILNRAHSINNKLISYRVSNDSYILYLILILNSNLIHIKTSVYHKYSIEKFYFIFNLDLNV